MTASNWITLTIAVLAALLGVEFMRRVPRSRIGERSVLAEPPVGRVRGHRCRPRTAAHHQGRQEPAGSAAFICASTGRSPWRICARNFTVRLRNIRCGINGIGRYRSPAWPRAGRSNCVPWWARPTRRAPGIRAVTCASTWLRYVRDEHPGAIPRLRVDTLDTRPDGTGGNLESADDRPW